MTGLIWNVDVVEDVFLYFVPKKPCFFLLLQLPLVRPDQDGRILHERWIPGGAAQGQPEEDTINEELCALIVIYGLVT